MHDLRTIIKLNAPINQRTSAAAKASAIAVVAAAIDRQPLDVPFADAVKYEVQCPVCDAP